MKLSNVYYLAAVATIASGCCTQRKPVAWEYRVVQDVARNRGLETKLNEAGKAGFMIDSIVTIPPPKELVGATPETMVILKRPTQ